jgi:competence protein ComFB
MSLRDDCDFDSLRNEAERLVVDELERQLAALDRPPRDAETILDIAALALNHVPPFYNVSLLGKLYAKAIDETDYAQKARTAVRDAIRKVLANPNP